jgi:hypothetical protein
VVALPLKSRSLLEAGQSHRLTAGGEAVVALLLKSKHLLS